MISNGFQLGVAEFIYLAASETDSGSASSSDDLFLFESPHFICGNE